MKPAKRRRAYRRANALMNGVDIGHECTLRGGPWRFCPYRWDYATLVHADHATAASMLLDGFPSRRASQGRLK
jgi:hypothetical protein